MNHSHDHAHGAEAGFPWREWAPAAISFGLLLLGICWEKYRPESSVSSRLAIFLPAYAPVAWPVLKNAGRSIAKGDWFSEFFLMGVATLGAFAIGAYAEAVAVMLFYTVGENLQHSAVHRARRSIQALLDVRPRTALVVRDGREHEVAPQTVEVGATIRVRPGGRVPLDGVLISEVAALDTAALTGESLPVIARAGDTVLAGSIATDRLAELRVVRPFAESSLARMLDLVQHAAARKAPTEQFIRRFARVYTPAVCALAALICFAPFFFVENYDFRTWLYRALIFLVISCPCALVISIPLGYFGGIGAASRQGILFKGANFLDAIRRIDTLAVDKTGTLTQGVFRVETVGTGEKAPFSENEWIRLAAALESASTHPVARAVRAFAENKNLHGPAPENVREFAGLGLSGNVDGRPILTGNRRLMEHFGVRDVPDNLPDTGMTIVYVAVDGLFAGYFGVADTLKPDAREAVEALRRAGISRIVILSGDRQAVTDRVAQALQIGEAHGELLPEDKMTHLETLKKQGARLAFAGDGLNDAPALALADVGIAMGALGSDAAIETADVVIQTDQVARIATAVQIGRATHRVVVQNIGLAFGVKFGVMALGVAGFATMWGAVFADVGVALLAIGNAIVMRRPD